MRDFMDRTSVGPKELEPVRKQNVGRVVGSSAMKLYDNNLIVMPRDLADGGTPIIFNNACVSWHRLASTLMFANARAYIGTLIEVTPFEAWEIAVEISRQALGQALSRCCLGGAARCLWVGKPAAIRGERCLSAILAS